MSKNSRSTSRLSRSATAKNTASCTLALGVGLDEQVHRPVGLVLVHRVEPGDRDVAGCPLGGGQLRGLGRLPGSPRVRTAPVPPSVVNRRPPSTFRRATSTSRAVPQPVEQPRRPRWARGDQAQSIRPASVPVTRHRVGPGTEVGFAEVAVDRADQPRAAHRSRAGPHGPGWSRTFAFVVAPTRWLCANAR